MPTNRPPTQSPTPGLVIETHEDIAVVRLNRPDKRNAINDATMEALGAFFGKRPPGMKAAVLAAEGSHFCAGLDLKEHKHRAPEEVMHHSQMWNQALNTVQFSGVPIVTAMHGAVIGGGLEIATATHVRIAEEGTFYALPEAARGIYTGGGASVRVARIIGQGRMVEMMLTGRVYDTAEGQQLGLSHYVVPKGQGEAKALALARQIAGNASLSNYAIVNAIPRIADMSSTEGFFAESLMLAVVQTKDDAPRLLEDFLEKRVPGLANFNHKG